MNDETIKIIEDLILLNGGSVIATRMLDVVKCADRVDDCICEFSHDTAACRAYFDELNLALSRLNYVVEQTKITKPKEEDLEKK